MKLETKQWHKVTSGKLDDLGKYFTSKDVMLLEALFREEHEIQQDELEAIMGKALPVSEG
jgi:hypothetical protein